jgi:hypothetical protein
MGGEAFLLLKRRNAEPKSPRRAKTSVAILWRILQIACWASGIALCDTAGTIPVASRVPVNMANRHDLLSSSQCWPRK